MDDKVYYMNLYATFLHEQRDDIVSECIDGCLILSAAPGRLAILSESSDIESMKKFKSLQLPEDTKYVILREKSGPPIYFINYEGLHAVSILVERNDSYNFKEIRKPKILTKKLKLRSMR